MATQTVEFRAASGLTLTVRLFAVGSDTIVQTASAVVESGNRKGTYQSLFADVAAGEYELIALSGTTPVCRWFCTLTLTTMTFQAYEVRTAGVVSTVTLAQAFPANFASLGINSSGHVSRVTLVDTCTANTDMRGTDNAALASAWTATRAGYLDGVLLADNYNIRVVAVTGSKHVASVVHSVEPAAIPEDAFVDGALSNRVLAANAAAEVATAVRTELATELARIDVASSSRLASNAYTAPDNAGIAAVKVVTDKVNTGLVQDGAVWQFTVNMLENGPAGGGGGSATLGNQILILDQLDVIQNKTDLLNPAPTGSVLLVDSGEFYCTRQDVELIFGKSSVRTWADVDNEGDEDFISDRILTMIALAHEQTNDGLRNGGYVVPFTSPRPASLTYNVAALAGVLLYESRGAIDADNEDGTHRLTPYRKRWDKYIKQLLSQQVRIDATRQNATTAPAVY